MTTFTPVSQLPRPDASDPPNAPAQLSDLTTRLDTLVIPKFVSASARNAAIPAPVDGQVAWVGDSRTLTAYRSDIGDWVNYPTYQDGTLTVTGSGNNFTRTVTFPKPFAAIPRVYCSITSGLSTTARCCVRPTSIGTTGFTMFLFYAGDGTTSMNLSSMPVDWTAIL